VKALEEIQARFKRGVPLHEFATLWQQLLRETELRNEFGFLEDAVDFLKAEGADQYPRLEGYQVNEGTQWVALKGYYPMWRHEGDSRMHGTNGNGNGHGEFRVKAKPFVWLNVLAIKSRVLVLDERSSRIWGLTCSGISTTDAYGMIRQHGVAVDRAIQWLLMIRGTFPPEIEETNDRELRSWWRKLVRGFGSDPSPYVPELLEAMKDDGRCGASHLLADIVNGSWTLARSEPVYFRGAYHLLAVPTWTMRLNHDYHIEWWDYFH
jgi:hypothetical protein